MSYAKAGWRTLKCVMTGKSIDTLVVTRLSHSLCRVWKPLSSLAGDLTSIRAHQSDSSSQSWQLNSSQVYARSSLEPTYWIADFAGSLRCRYRTPFQRCQWLYHQSQSKPTFSNTHELRQPESIKEEAPWVILSSKSGLLDTVEGGKPLHRTVVKSERLVSPVTVGIGVTFPSRALRSDARVSTQSKAASTAVSEGLWQSYWNAYSIWYHGSRSFRVLDRSYTEEMVPQLEVYRIHR
jgi:hypothetical protein